MGWSTRELAELAGTTVKAVRYYHQLGLLEQPERAANGYKKYRVPHLVRLLRIRRLVDLGVPLADLPAVEASDETAEQTFRALDAELAASIERQQRMREDLALILRDRSLAHLPPGFAREAADVSETDRALLMLYSRLFRPTAMDALRELHAVPRTPAEVDFDTLSADADETARHRLAERYAPEVRRQLDAHPALKDPVALAARGEEQAVSVVVQAMVELYNPAQLDVLRRVTELMAED